MTKLSRRLIIGIFTAIVEGILLALKFYNHFDYLHLVLGSMISFIAALFIDFILDKKEIEFEYLPYKNMISKFNDAKIIRVQPNLINDITDISLHFSRLNKFSRAEVTYIISKLIELNIVETEPSEIHEYIHYTFSKQFKMFRNLINGETISCSYSEQIDVANKISETVNERFWATSFDVPSRIWKEGVKYFNTLEKSTKELNIPTGNEEIPNKARIVIVTLADLFNDYIYEKENYIKFMNWHIKNGWGLRLYIYFNKDVIEQLIFRTIMGDDEPLSDFLIKDRKLVYGRVDEKENLVFLKLIYATIENEDKCPTIESYENLFISLWDDSLTLERTQQELQRENIMKIKVDEIKREFAQEFSSKPTGIGYLEAVANKISCAQKSIIALDIAETKEAGLVGWALVTEYNSFLNATILAAEKGIEVKRIFAINNLASLKDKDNFVKNVMIRQLEKNINLGFVLMKDCQEKRFSQPDDFIIADDNFCFYLGNDNFKAEELSYLKTLIPKSLIINYKKDFFTLWNYEGTKKFLGANDVDEFNKFVNNILS
ncbi:MAG: hypothetical protein C4517_09300 [Stygiobacter sp.]|nr:MAG: hypothetical protein C4517_09300 [Stygiobacter sp.]